MIGAILNKSLPSSISHVKKLSDLKNCLVTWKVAEKEDGKKRMVCPVSREDLDAGNSRAVVIWSSGAVVGVKSLKALKAKECPVTGKPFDWDQDVITLAPNEEEFAKLREKLPAAAAGKKRKAESSAASSAADNASATGAAAEATVKDGSDAAEKKAKKDDDKAEGKVKSSQVYKSLFCTDREGLSGPRDAFGKPLYNVGSRCS